MRKNSSFSSLIFLFVSLLSFHTCNSQDFFSIYQKKEISYFLSLKKILIKFETMPQANYIDSIFFDAKGIKAIEVKGSNGFMLVEMDEAKVDKSQIRNLIRMFFFFHLIKNRI